VTDRVPSADALKRLIVESLNLQGVAPESIGDDDPLFEGGLGLDSIDALEIVVAIEKRFGVKVRSEDVRPASMATVSELVRFVERLLGVRPGPSH
jgi:acyl carrier protein